MENKSLQTNPVWHKYLLLTAAIALFISFFRLGSITLFDVDEAVFSEATKEMVQSGDWITPTYNGENRYDKPILLYWLMAASYKVFGINEFAARFPSALSGVLLCFSIFLFVMQLYSDKKAVYAAVSFGLSLYYLTYSHAAVTDMVLTLFISLSLFSFYLSLKKNRRYIYGFYLFSSLAFLTKGLIGIVFPFGIAFIYLLITEGLKGMRKGINIWGIILFIVISFPWYIAQYLINGQEFIQQFIIKHHFMRYAGVISGHRGPFYYYIPVIIVGLFPWIAFLPSGIGEVFNTIKSLKDWRNLDKNGDNHGFFFLIWLSIIFLFFSFSTTKLPNYIFPAIPAASILIANGMCIKQRSSIKRKLLSILNMRERYSDIFIVVVSSLAGIAFLLSGKYLSAKGISDIDWTFGAAFLMFALALISLYGMREHETQYGYISIVMVSFFALLLVKAMPVANKYLQGTLYKYSLYARDSLRNDESIIAYRLNNPSIVFYSGHKIINARGMDTLSSAISNINARIAIIKTKDIDLMAESGFHLLEKDEKYAIFERD
jgi:4-amino-4-deoxy-L-arabinose transferase-like glycosyltransferase